MEDYEYDEDLNPAADKYREALTKFDAPPAAEKLASIVASLKDRHYDENFTPDVLKFIHGCIDLTTLTSLDTRESVWAMVDKKVNRGDGARPDMPNVAAVCTYPLFVDTVKQALTAHDVKIAAVAGGFPASQTFTEIKVAEAAMAVAAGAEEIDVVMNIGYLIEEDYEALADELSEIKESCRGATMKVIIETGVLATADVIRRATVMALYSGADFVKTSTGKEYPGATPEAVYVMCKVIGKYAEITGRKAGIKISGGIRAAEDAVSYYTIVKETLGKEWLNKNLFRIGASKLAENIERIIEI